MTPRISKTEWIIMYVLAVIIDVAQFLGVLFFLDPILAVIIFVYFQFGKKVSLTSKPGRLASIFGSEIFGNFTSGVAPLWILEIFYLQRSVRTEDAEIAAQKAESDIINADYRNTLNTEIDGVGVRPPRSSQVMAQRNVGANTEDSGAGAVKNRIKLYSDGIGRPRGEKRNKWINN